MKTVYLAGPIAEFDYAGAVSWREHAIDEFMHYGIEAKSPMRGKKFLKGRGKIGTGQHPENPLSSTNGVINLDRMDCQKSDALLVNLLGAKERSIGTMVEFGWADSARVPIVVVMETDNPHEHLFVRGLATYIVDNIDEGIRLVATLLNRQDW